MTLPSNKMYALRHGVSKKVWIADGGKWLWNSVQELTKAWNSLKSLGLVESNIKEHRIVTIKLEEM